MGWGIFLNNLQNQLGPSFKDIEQILEAIRMEHKLFTAEQFLDKVAKKEIQIEDRLKEMSEIIVKSCKLCLKS